MRSIKLLGTMWVAIIGLSVLNASDKTETFEDEISYNMEQEIKNINNIPSPDMKFAIREKESQDNFRQLNKTEIEINEDPQIIEVNLKLFKNIKKGDILATGKRNSLNEPCQASFGIISEFSFEERGSKSIQTIVDQNCNVIVVDKNENLFSAVLSTPALVNQDTGYSYIFMYGYGGLWDKLSEVYSQMTWAWNGNLAWRVGENGWCKWSAGTGWSNTECIYWYDPYSGDWVKKFGRGSFQWISNYNHTLYTPIFGSKTGVLNCYYYFSGSIVSGTNGSCGRGVNNIKSD